MATKESYASGESVAFLRIELKRGEFHLLPYGSLISAHLVLHRDTSGL